MNLTFKATITKLTEPKQLDQIYVTDVYVQRASGKHTNHNILKLFHKREDHGLLLQADYNIDVDLRGRKTKDGRVFNELKIIKILEV